MKMHCAQRTAFTLKPVGWSLQITAFATESTHFKLQSIVKHVESAKHKKRRDKCVWQNVQDHQVQSLRHFIVRMLI